MEVPVVSWWLSVAMFLSECELLEALSEALTVNRGIFFTKHTPSPSSAAQPEKVAHPPMREEQLVGLHFLEVCRFIGLEPGPP